MSQYDWRASTPINVAISVAIMAVGAAAMGYYEVSLWFGARIFIGGMALIAIVWLRTKLRTRPASHQRP